MKDDFLLKKIIIYGMGVIFICAWAIFRLIPYNIAMYLATAIFAYSMFVEAQHDFEEGRKGKAIKKIILCAFTLVCLLIIGFLNP